MIFVIFLSIFLRTLSYSFVEGNVIFTCCGNDGILQEGGSCASSSYEFEVDTIPDSWKIPEGVLGKSGIYKLEKRAPWCKCTSRDKIRLEMGKSPLRDEWTLLRTTPSKNVSLNNEGHLIIDGEGHSKEEFCIENFRERIHPSVTTLLVEFAICTEMCMPPLGAALSPKTGDNLQLEKKEWQHVPFCPHIKAQNDLTLALENVNNSSETLSCEKWTDFYRDDDEFFVIRKSKNKTIAIQDSTYDWAYLLDHACREDLGNAVDITVTNSGNGHLIPKGNLKFCVGKIKQLYYGYQEIFAIISGISAFFLLLNLTIYFSLREDLSIAGWTEFIYSLSLYGYFVLSIVGLLVVPEDANVGSFCFAISFLTQFFEIANGTTLVALSFDIFWTFWRFDHQGYTDSPKVSKFRVILYLLLSLIVPTSVVIFGIVGNCSPWRFNSVPHYGLLQCTAPTWHFGSSVLFTMQGMNLTLVLLSAYIILRKKHGENFYGEDGDTALDPDRMDIFSKLFVFVFLFFLLGFAEFLQEFEPFGKLFIFFKVAQYLQGVFAFLILICNRKTLRAMCRGQWSLTALFRHACCTCGNGKANHGSLGDLDEIPVEEVPLSPLMKKMKAGSIKRSTVRGNAFY